MRGTKRIEDITNKCYQREVPVNSGEATNIEITNKKFDVNLIDRGYLTVDMKAVIRFENEYVFQEIEYEDGTLYNDAKDEYSYEEHLDGDAEPVYYKNVDFVDYAPIFFIGWKNAAECVQQMEVMNRKQPTGYMHYSHDKDVYLESMKYTTKTEKENMRYCYTAYENVLKNDPRVAGCYIKFIDFEKELIDEDVDTLYFEHHLERPYKVMPLSATAANCISMVTGNLVVVNNEYAIPDFKGIMKIFEYKNSTHFLYGWKEGEIYFNYDMKKEINPDNGNVEYYAIDIPSKDKAYSPVQYDIYSTYKMFPNTTMIEFNNPGPETFKFINSRRYGITPNKDYFKDIHLVIPIKQFTAFRHFPEFDKAFGDIVLQMLFGTRAMVSCFAGHTSNPELLDIILPIDEIGFQQIGTPLNFEVNANAMNQTIYVRQLVITKLEAEVYGYNITNEEKQMINTIRAQNPIIYKCRHTDFASFDNYFSNGQLDSEITQQLRLVRDIHLAFPLHTGDVNRFMNPCLKDLNLIINDVVYPHNTAWRTDDVRFIQTQIGDFDADDDYLRSYYYNCIDTDALVIDYTHDRTNFIITWHVGLNDFDGFNSKNNNMNIRVRAQIYNDLPENKTPLRNPSYPYPPPQIWFTTDTFWTLDVDNGLVYHKYRKP